MKNITLAIEDDVLAEARVIAAERNTSVNALVREFLSGLSQQKDRRRRAMMRLKRLSEKSEARLGPDYKFDRESLYDR